MMVLDDQELSKSGSPNSFDGGEQYRYLILHSEFSLHISCLLKNMSNYRKLNHDALN